MAKRRTRRTKTTKPLTIVEQMQAEYNAYRRNALHCATAAEWEAAVEKLLKKRFGDCKPTMRQLVDAARDATTKCDRCGGSGRYQWGAVVNGRCTNSGPCFRCQEKGYFTQEDYRRNWGYDNHQRVI